MTGCPSIFKTESPTSICPHNCAGPPLASPACVRACVRACAAGATQTVSACQQGDVHTHTHTRPARCCSRQGDWISVMQLRAAWLFVCGGVFVCACVCSCVRAIRGCHRSRPLVTLLLPHRTCHHKLFGGCVKVKHHADPALPRLLLLRRGRLLRVTSSQCARACGRTGMCERFVHSTHACRCRVCSRAHART
jgi:hypothetical protein